MTMHRRRFFISSAGLIAAGNSFSPALAQDASRPVLGSSAGEFAAVYPELPEGQAYPQFEVGQDLSLYVDFGDADAARTIYVSGPMEREAADTLIMDLLPEDAESLVGFEINEAAGSIFRFAASVYDSPSLEGVFDGRSRVIAKYIVETNSGDAYNANHILLALEEDVE